MNAIFFPSHCRCRSCSPLKFNKVRIKLQCSPHLTNSVLTNHPGLTNRFLTSNIFYFIKTSDLTNIRILTNNWLGPERFVKFGDHCNSGENDTMAGFEPSGKSGVICIITFNDLSKYSCPDFHPWLTTPNLVLDSSNEVFSLASRSLLISSSSLEVEITSAKR